VAIRQKKFVDSPNAELILKDRFGFWGINFDSLFRGVHHATM
jgi:hypothetical protein